MVGVPGGRVVPFHSQWVRIGLDPSGPHALYLRFGLAEVNVREFSVPGRSCRTTNLSADAKGRALAPGISNFGRVNL